MHMFFGIPQRYVVDIYGFYFEEYILGYLQPNKTHRQFHYDGKTLTKEETDPLLMEKALAHAQWASWSYSNRVYKLPSIKISSSSPLEIINK